MCIHARRACAHWPPVSCSPWEPSRWSACSTAAHAITLGRDYIRNGLVDVAIVGASESVITYGTMKAWQAMHVLSPEGCFPFAKKRNGTVLGEAMQLALADAGLKPEQIDYLNAHGTATTINDKNETNAIKRVFGDHAPKLAISSTKSMHGHPLGAGGGIEAVACIKAMQDNWVPPTIGLDEPDPECDLDYVPNVGREMRVTYTMSNSFAFGGINAVLVFGPPPG